MAGGRDGRRWERSKVEDHVSADTSEHDDTLPLLIAQRPVLKVADATMAGYRRFEDQEQFFRIQTFIEHPELVACWIHYLDLYHETIEAENEHPDIPKPTSEAEDLALHLQIRLYALAGGTAKMVFDAACAGLYVQAYALCRHLVETWVQIVYVIAKPDMAARWFNLKPDDPSHKPPKDTSMHKAIRTSPETKHAVGILDMVITNIRRYDDLAHPGDKTLGQTGSTHETKIQVGGNYNRDLAIGALDEGAAALRILLQVWASIIPQSDAWSSNLQVNIERHQKAMKKDLL